MGFLVYNLVVVVVVVVDFLVSSNTEDKTFKHTKVHLFPMWSSWFLRVSFSRVHYMFFPSWDLLLPLT